MTDAPQALWDEIAEYLAAEHLELDDVELVGAERGGRTLRVVVDGPGGIDVERLGRLSRAVSRLVDDHDVIAGSYRLEVTSPGLERKLRRPRHWEKSVGRLVKVKTRVEIDGARRHDGVIRAADGEACVVDVEGSPRRIPYEAVASAKTVFEWKTPAKPGARRK